MGPVVPVADRHATDDGNPRLVEARVGRDGAVVERPGQGHDLHHRSGLIETRDDRVDELRGRRRRKLVRVVAGHVRPGDDATGGGLHDDQGAALRLVFLHAIGQRPLGDHLDGAIERQLQRHAVDRVAALSIAQHDRPVRQVAHRRLESRLPRERLVVIAFDAVVALPRVVREAQQVGGEGGSRDATIDIGPLGLRHLADSREAHRIQLLRDRGRNPARQVDELARRGELGLDVGGAELEQRRQPGGYLSALGRGQQVGRRKDRKDGGVRH